MSLAEKTMIITGAAKGMGRASAKLCAERGAAVVAADLDSDGLRTLVEEIKDAGGAVISRVTDVTVESEVQALVDAAVAEFGSVNVLYNNAYAVHPNASGDVLGTTLEAWEWTIRTCVTSQFLCARAAIPHMITAGGGSIINVSSGNGLNGASSAAAYGVAKAGSAIFTKYLATQYGKQGIRANTIVPGWTVETGWTGPVKDMTPEGQELLRQALDDVCMTRLAVPEDIAPLVAFLASDQAGYLQGATIEVNGGLLAHMPGSAGAPSSPSVMAIVPGS